MAAPLGQVQAAQEIAQKAQSRGSDPVAKQGPSRFDKAMGQEASRGAHFPVQNTPTVQQTPQVSGVETVGKTEQARLNRVKRETTVNKSDFSKTTEGLARLLEDIEKGEGVMNKLIKSASSGKNFSNAELIALQAGMYKYTQELELTGKVVEKATSGLKDTLKTQV